ncbi:MAG: histidine kinase [Ignavibacteriae bacterium HGW-Ignavibacteriae-3]|nr:MAG: histidine kinase [Ignavibacteriae bacterium HGW-Ignavibacteriae-3]
MKKQLLENFKKYHFEFKHLTVLFIGLIIFQLVLSYVHKASLHNFVENTQEWFQKHSAERFANLSTTTLELLLETSKMNSPVNETDKRKIIQFFDIILNQQVLQQNVEEICLLVNYRNEIKAIDDGRVLFSFIFNQNLEIPESSLQHKEAIRIYDSVKTELVKTEQIINVHSDKQTYHIFVPFVPSGEFIGALYMRNTADVSFIQREIVSNYEETSLIYSSLFLLGLLAMYYISTYTVKERDETQKLLLEEHESSIKQIIEHDKEAMFTKRIYHTHHKAEKVMGFIKDDLRMLSPDNINEVKYRVSRYSNFISRVIYDMKWYDPPVQTIRNAVFKTDLNDVIRFIVENIFNRTARKSGAFKIRMDLDEKIPLLSINEFVVWEVLDPLIQNSIDHGGDTELVINIETKYDSDKKATTLLIYDNGPGIPPELLETNEAGVKKLFQENVSTKTEGQHSGYGCYIAYEISKQRCGWSIDVENLEGGGCKFTIGI